LHIPVIKKILTRRTAGPVAIAASATNVNQALVAVPDSDRHSVFLMHLKKKLFHFI